MMLTSMIMNGRGERRIGRVRYSNTVKVKVARAAVYVRKKLQVETREANTYLSTWHQHGIVSLWQRDTLEMAFLPTTQRGGKRAARASWTRSGVGGTYVGRPRRRARGTCICRELSAPSPFGSMNATYLPHGNGQ